MFNLKNKHYIICSNSYIELTLVSKNNFIIVRQKSVLIIIVQLIPSIQQYFCSISSFLPFGSIITWIIQWTCDVQQHLIQTINSRWQI
ncbi:hypothetical protein EZS27_014823 [termite gut metagenome]|uniref:Uncharacterized protein n=1 Tax=termite gut metagenome TaxID=433724 RepID=A0A5J4RVT3_9ZZZZ